MVSLESVRMPASVSVAYEMSWIAVPCVFERRLRDDESPHAVAELLEILIALTASERSGARIATQSCLLSLWNGATSVGARFFFGDESQRVGVDRFAR